VSIRSRALWLGVSFLAVCFLGGVTSAADAVTGPSRCASDNGMVIRVDGVRSSRGNLLVVLYGDRPEDFLKKGKRIAKERVPAVSGSMEVCLSEQRPGTYAVAVYHDENGNGRFDRAWTGLPSEGFGISNNPHPWLRAPTYQEAAFKFDHAKPAVAITLSYP